MSAAQCAVCTVCAGSSSSADDFELLDPGHKLELHRVLRHVLKAGGLVVHGGGVGAVPPAHQLVLLVDHAGAAVPAIRSRVGALPISCTLLKY